ncbi:MAG: hydrogenase small subunit, partial [Acidobacteriota bacterium]
MTPPSRQKAATTEGSRAARAKSAVPGRAAPPRAVHPWGTQSVHRAISILRELATKGQYGLRLVDIAGAMGLERPTAHRIVKGLMAQGMIMQDPDTRTYRLGHLVYELGLAASPHFTLRELCQPGLQRLAEKSGDSVFLLVKSGQDSVCLDRFEGSFQIKARTLDIGVRRPLGVGAGGLSLLMALPPAAGLAMAEAMAAAKRPSVIWLPFQECTGCTESITRSHSPTLESLIFDVISLDYQETLMAAAGHQAEEALQKAMKDNEGKYLLIVDGSIPLGLDGAYSCIGGKSNLATLKEVAKGAAAIVAMGSCAAYGGIPKANPNPTGAVSVSDIIKDKPIVNIPGCPPIPVVMTGRTRGSAFLMMALSSVAVKGFRW